MLFYFATETIILLTVNRLEKRRLGAIFLINLLTDWGLICVYYMLKRKEAFNPDRFYGDKKIENKDSGGEHLA